MKDILEKAHQWLNSEIDDDSRMAIQKLLDKNDSAALTEAFYKDLEFGTGGLRGIMGVGSNYMNRYTVGMATQGLANYLKKIFPGEQIKAAIAYDSRNNSRFFAETTAAVLSANDIKVYLFESLRPTPELSFTIRYLNCHTGVVITASHNPKEYNGYKAYWTDGAQLISPHDKNVINEVRKITSINDVSFEMKEELIELIGESIDKVYLDKLAGLSISPDINEAHKNLSIVFSSIHGTGIQLVPAVLRRFGFENVNIVEEQATPDGNFSTVVYPNPEESEALNLALKRAKELDADLVMATDPDADRVGIAVKDDQNEWVLLNGNQTAALLIYYILKRKQELGTLKDNNYVVKTIVTTDLIQDIAESFNVNCYETLTGFKYIAELIRQKEGTEEYIAGGEESYGYLIGDFVRDKDAVASCAILAEMAAYARHQGKAVYQLLDEIYQRYGYYKEVLISVTKTGKAGAEEIQAMMEKFRADPPTAIGNENIQRVRDYLYLEEKDLNTGKVVPLNFTKSNVLQFYTAQGSKISVRPSGTEPKIKFYISLNEKDKNKVDSRLEKLKEGLQHLTQ